MTTVAIEKVKTIALSLSDPSAVKEASSADRSQENGWDDLSISSGYPGPLLLFAELQRVFPNEAWDRVVWDYVVKITQSIESKPISNLSLFNGLTGCCLAIQQASLDGTRYQKVLKPLHDFILKHIESTYLVPIRCCLKRGGPVRMDLYDLRHGIVGLGVYCLRNFDIPSFNYMAGEIISTLIPFTLPARVNGYEVPGWHLDQEEAMKYGEEDFPSQRYFNLSMLHGITGVLAFFSIAFKRGVRISGMEEAIRRMISWIQQKRRTVDALYYWDKGVSFDDETTARCSPLALLNEGWDCGTPGVARALSLAGMALNDDALTHDAVESFHSVFEKNRRVELSSDPSFSTGTSGLYLLTHLMARDSNSLFLKEKSVFLHDQLLKQLEEYAVDKEGERGGILTGIQDLVLTLLSPENGTFSWHTPFLIDWI